jgi:hypothetical protein
LDGAVKGAPGPEQDSEGLGASRAVAFHLCRPRRRPSPGPRGRTSDREPGQDSVRRRPSLPESAGYGAPAFRQERVGIHPPARSSSHPGRPAEELLEGGKVVGTSVRDQVLEKRDVLGVDHDRQQYRSNYTVVTLRSRQIAATPHRIAQEARKTNWAGVRCRRPSPPEMDHAPSVNLTLTDECVWRTLPVLGLGM